MISAVSLHHIQLPQQSKQASKHSSLSCFLPSFLRYFISASASRIEDSVSSAKTLPYPCILLFVLTFCLTCSLLFVNFHSAIESLVLGAPGRRVNDPAMTSQKLRAERVHKYVGMPCGEGAVKYLTWSECQRA